MPDKVLFLGVGRVGSTALRMFLKEAGDAAILALDSNPSRRDVLPHVDNVDFKVVTKPSDLRELGRVYDLAMVALPSRVAPSYLRVLADMCIDTVDVSYIATDPYELQPQFEKCGAVYVPDAGFAPGYSNMLVGEAQRLLGELTQVDIVVGGIPEKPVGPLNYVVTWSAEDLVEEYVRCARIVVNGVTKCVDPLENVVKLQLEDFGELEGFYSDGLRTLLKNVKAVNMREITVRWPGHLEKMRLLRDLGLMDTKPLRVGAAEVAPRDVLVKVLEERLSAAKLGVADVALLEVRASGEKGNYTARAVLRGSVEKPATALFTAAVFAFSGILALRYDLGSGVKPLENLYNYREELDEFLKRTGVEITRRLSPG